MFSMMVWVAERARFYPICWYNSGEPQEFKTRLATKRASMRISKGTMHTYLQDMSEPCTTEYISEIYFLGEDDEVYIFENTKRFTVDIKRCINLKPYKKGKTDATTEEGEA